MLEIKKYQYIDCVAVNLKVMYWKSGFYHIARGANIPIVMGYIDYRRKAGGLRRSIIPTGDIYADMVLIRSFYAGVTGKYPEQSIDYLYI
ncbi:MAG: hypothetical protein HQK72_13620 [Desulfamplus sp.]|nr:hypothetical protein [Desulfamplus sp.]